MKERTNSLFAVVFPLLLVTGLIAWPRDARACEIDFEVTNGEREVYEADDMLTVSVVVTLTHRVCDVAMRATRFHTDGLEVVAATAWSQTGPTVWQRRLRVKVLGNDSGELTLTGVRTCDKDGGLGTLKLSGRPQDEEEG